MDCSVRGRTVYPGYVLDVRVEDGIELVSSPGTYRAVIFTAGSAFVAVNGVRTLVDAPSVLCLGARDTVELVRGDRVAWRQVFFKPTVINPDLTEARLESLVSGTGSCSPDSPYVQDLFYLHPFCGAIDRLVKLGPSSFERVTGVVDSLKRSHDGQIDLFWPCRSRSYFLEFLFFIRNVASQYADCAAGLSGGNDKFESILLFLHSNYERDIAMSELCERFAINRTSLNELFHEHVGMPVIQYLIALRINLACLMLRDTTLPVKEVIARIGYNDPINFNRSFKKRTAHTPAGYRREYCYMVNA